VGLHKTLQRTKLKMLRQKRLEQLEQIIKLLDLKDQWKSSPTWAQFIGLPAPATPSALDGYLALAKWNRGIDTRFSPYWERAVLHFQRMVVDVMSDSTGGCLQHVRRNPPQTAAPSSALSLTSPATTPLRPLVSR